MHKAGPFCIETLLFYYRYMSAPVQTGLVMVEQVGVVQRPCVFKA